MQTRTSRPPKAATTVSTRLRDRRPARSAAKARCGPALHLGDDRLDLLLARSTAATRAPAAAKASAASRPMPPAPPVSRTPLPSARPRDRTACPYLLRPLSAVRRRNRRLFLNVAGLRLAHEFCPILDQHGPKRLGRERRSAARCCRTRSRRPRPSRPPRGPALHLAEAQSADSRNCRTMSACGPVQWAKNSSRVMPLLRRKKLTRLIIEPRAPDGAARGLRASCRRGCADRPLRRPCWGRRQPRPGPPGSPGARRTTRRASTPPRRL